MASPIKKKCLKNSKRAQSEREEAELSLGGADKKIKHNALPQDTKQGSERERQSIRTAGPSAIMGKLTNGVGRSRDRLYLACTLIHCAPAGRGACDAVAPPAVSLAETHFVS